MGEMIDFSYNQLEGRIPRSLGNCKELEILNLGNNQINDTLPFGWDLFQSCNFSFCGITGFIVQSRVLEPTLSSPCCVLLTFHTIILQVICQQATFSLGLP